MTSELVFCSNGNALKIAARYPSSFRQSLASHSLCVELTLDLYHVYRYNVTVGYSVRIKNKETCLFLVFQLSFYLEVQVYDNSWMIMHSKAFVNTQASMQHMYALGIWYASSYISCKKLHFHDYVQIDITLYFTQFSLIRMNRILPPKYYERKNNAHNLSSTNLHYQYYKKEKLL